MQKNWRLRLGNDIFHQRWEHLKIVFTCRYTPFIHLSMRLSLHSFACLKCWSYHVPTNMHILTHMVHFTVATYDFLMKYDMKNMLDVRVLAKKVNFVVKRGKKLRCVTTNLYVHQECCIFLATFPITHTQFPINVLALLMGSQIPKSLQVSNENIHFPCLVPQLFI